MTDTPTFCEYCGAAMLPGSDVCPSCGQEASSTDSEAAPPASAESWGGFESLPFSEPTPQPTAPETDRWGSPAPRADDDSAERWGTPAEPERPAAVRPAAAVASVPGGYETKADLLPKKSNKWILWVVLGLVVICLCVALVGGLGFALFLDGGISTY